ncbi:hypothetical protein [Paenibacillus wynnii]|uniref:hypothetical protein n=1 Tax=Paenibacillus wynnii TaxID=268407 RepID=UPI00278E80BD|nr:hypothetical protein [Paenibacillus wynnii]MDQ0195161.1 hypothetical protein [Paenibacillus wynnii]
MTAPSLSHSRTNAHLFAEFVQKYNGSVYSLSSILTESLVKAEEITIHTFTELHKSFQQDQFNPQLGPTKLTNDVFGNALLSWKAIRPHPRFCSEVYAKK